MRLVVGFVVGFVVLVLGCTPPASPRPPPPATPTRVLTAAPDFTPRQLASLREAADRLVVATEGRVVFRIVPGAAWGQIRAHRSGDRWATWADAYFGVAAYGWTDAGHGAHLVVDRLESDHAFVHTAMHELLHVAGVDHVETDPGALMFPRSDARFAPLTLTQADRDAIAAVLNCATW